MPTQPTSRRTANYQQQEIVDLNEKEVAIIKKKLGTGTNVNDITDMSLTLGDLTVQYDTTHGIQIEATGKISYKDGKEDQPIVNIEMPLVAGQGVTIDKAADSEKIVVKFDAEGADTQFKTLFGDQHIVGKGNIDLYEHDVEITGTNIDVLVTIYSSKNTKIDSLTDLKLVCGDTFVKQCSGQVNGKAAYAITQTSIKLVDGTTQLLTGVTYNDNLTTI